VQRREATLKDVANIAGVSTATIARVLQNNGYVAEETRVRVEAAIAQSGYRVNAVARGLRRQRTHTIGHILRTSAPNPFFATVAQGVHQEAAANGVSVLIVNTHGDPAAEQAAVDTLLSQRVEAILFTTLTANANVERAAKTGIPIVQVERAGSIDTHWVRVDNYVGSRAATEHLLSLGHRRIAFIGVDPEFRGGYDGDLPTSKPEAARSVERERLAGYVDALAGHGIAPEEQLLLLGNAYYSPQRGRTLTHSLLALDHSIRPTAIFASCDLLASGVLQGLHDAGISVPAEMSVIGFDDTVAEHLTPALTTVAQPMLELGRVATRLALRETGEKSFCHEMLTTKLVIRESTGPVCDQSPLKLRFSIAANHERTRH